MDIFDQVTEYGHEQLMFCSDDEVGLKAIIGIHDTTLGPALGGTRMFPYDSEEAAILDVLRLSQGMTFKNAAAGLDLGGGKAVIIGDPARDKNNELFHSYGRFVNSLNGKYITAGDIGTTSEDLLQISKETKWVGGLPVSANGLGDSAPATALGVLYGMKACAKEVFGSDSLEGKTVAIQGIGKCGYHLSRLLHKEGAQLIIADVNAESTIKVANETGAIIEKPHRISSSVCDIFAPCAVGATINDKSIPELRCKIIAGSANNQLANEIRNSLALGRLGITYAPDYIVNAGGVIHVAFEVAHSDARSVLSKVSEIYNTMEKVFGIARSRGISTVQAARSIVDERLSSKRKQPGKHG
jgi:leucine dehydrogenase